MQRVHREPALDGHARVHQEIIRQIHRGVTREGRVAGNAQLAVGDDGVADERGVGVADGIVGVRETPAVQEADGEERIVNRQRGGGVV